VQLAPTPRSTVLTDGAARLVTFPSNARAATLPVVIVPSLINRWYVLDLRKGSSVVEALTDAGLSVYCLDWGEPGDEDRYLEWDDVLDRLARMIRRVRRETGAPKVGLLGYCIGGTLSAIHTALHPTEIAALVNLAGPIDFSCSGMLGTMVDRRWFDPEAIASAGNIGAHQMQSGFVALRPTGPVAKWVGLFAKLDPTDPRMDDKLEAFRALEAWASDNIAFPAAAYVRYIRELYQDNQLVRGEHVVRGRRVDLSSITCPIMNVVTERDVICPPDSARALGAASGSDDVSEVLLSGGHVGAVIGGQAKRELYPQLVNFFIEKLARPATVAEA
jgi:polyhydroxyalkanoate synthase